jgi:hypothetical protein
MACQWVSSEVNMKGVKKCFASNGGVLWNGREEDGGVRCECEEDEGTDCEDGDSDTDW